MTKPKGKPDGWEEALNGYIRDGVAYQETNKLLVEKLGELGGVSGAAYQRHKKKITGGKPLDNKLEEIGDRAREAKDEAAPQRPPWNKTKQNAADTSKLAELLNKGIYSGVMPFCASKKLKVEDVQEINLGGGIVAIIQWGFPGINLEHPIIVLVTRVIMFYLKFRQVCKLIRERVECADGITETIGGVKGGLKEGWETLK